MSLGGPMEGFIRLTQLVISLEDSTIFLWKTLFYYLKSLAWCHILTRFSITNCIPLSCILSYCEIDKVATHRLMASKLSRISYQIGEPSLFNDFLIDLDFLVYFNLFLVVLDLARWLSQQLILMTRDLFRQ